MTTRAFAAQYGNSPGQRGVSLRTRLAPQEHADFVKPQVARCYTMAIAAGATIIDSAAGSG
jgi:hypothetical protein